MKKIIIIITCFIGLSGAFAQQRGMFHNPVIEADVPDPSMIRVGNYYYLVSTTMHLMPGCPVMRSKDLVHWETISYVFQRLTDLPRYDLKEGTVYGRGQWASSLRYHDGRFYVWFSPNDEPIVVISIPPKIRRANGHYFPVRLIIMMLLCFLMTTAKSICFMAPGNFVSSRAT